MPPLHTPSIPWIGHIGSRAGSRAGSPAGSDGTGEWKEKGGDYFGSTSVYRDKKSAHRRKKEKRKREEIYVRPVFSASCRMWY